MDIKKVLGEAYREDMTAEELAEALKGIEVIDKNDVPDLSDYVPKSQYDKASSDAAGWKKKYRTTLDEKEREKIEAEEAANADKEELEALRKQVKQGEYTKEFLKMGFNDKLAEQSAEAMYSGDTTTLFTNITKALNSAKKSAETDLLEKTPTPPTSNNPDVGEKKLSDMSLDELQAEIDSNPDALS